LIYLNFFNQVNLFLKEVDFEEDAFDDNVPTVPSRQTTLPTTPVPETLIDLRSSSSVAVAPNLLIAQVILMYM